MRGRFVDRLVYAQPVLWYAVCGPQPVLLVICRDPKGHEPDDLFFTTDLNEPASKVVGRYAGRWPIEDAFRNVKQFLGVEQPQRWKRLGPERALALGSWLYTAIWDPGYQANSGNPCPQGLGGVAPPKTLRAPESS